MKQSVLKKIGRCTTKSQRLDQESTSKFYISLEFSFVRIYTATRAIIQLSSWKLVYRGDTHWG